jgi:hypothetical protein
VKTRDSVIVGGKRGFPNWIDIRNGGLPDGGMPTVAGGGRSASLDGFSRGCLNEVSG